MDVRDKVARAVKTDTPRNKATSLSSVRTKRAHKLSDDIRDKVLKAVEGGMTCRQAAAHCGVSLASAIRFAKRAGITDKRAKAKKNVRDKVHDKVLKAVKGGMSCHQAAAHYGVSSTTALNWAKNANIPRTRTSTKGISDKVRDKVLKAVEGGMSCRQAAAHCGVSLASATRCGRSTFEHDYANAAPPFARKFAESPWNVRWRSRNSRRPCENSR